MPLFCNASIHAWCQAGCSTVSSTRSTSGVIWDLLTEHLPKKDSKAWDTQELGKSLRLASFGRVLLAEHDVVLMQSIFFWRSKLSIRTERPCPGGWMGTHVPFLRSWGFYTTRSTSACQQRTRSRQGKRLPGAGQPQPCRA